jgi:hypothetical protein
MQPVVKTVTGQATDIDGFVVTQSILSAITVGGALASSGLTAANIITATVTGNQSSATALVTGTDADGRSMTETLTLTNASTTLSTKYFKTVVSVTIGGTPVAGNFTLGHTMSDGFVSASIPCNWRSDDFKASVFVKLGTSGTYTVQHTPTDIQSLTAVRQWYNHDSMAALTANDDGNYLFPITAIRLLMTAQVGATTLTVLENR